MKTHHDPRLGETLYETTLPSGLRLVMLPRPGWSRTLVHLTVPFGGGDRALRVAGRDLLFPAGTAHLLEHVLFAVVSRRLGDLLQRHGAQMAAETRTPATQFTLGAGERPEELAAAMVAGLANAGDLPADLVEHEKAIICREISEGEANADRRCREQMLRALFHRHPVRESITGTPDDLAQIAPELLQHCYGTFYTPGAMTLYAVGPLDPDHMAAQVGTMTGDAPKPVERVVPTEPDYICQRHSRIELPGARPLVRVAFKERDFTGPALRRELLSAVTLDALTEQGGPLHLAPGLRADYLGSDTYGYSFFSASATPDPAAFADRLLAAIAGARESGLPDGLFERAKRNRLTRLLRYFDRPDAIAQLLVHCAEQGADLLDYLPVVDSLTVDEANQRIREHLDPEYAAVVTVG